MSERPGRGCARPGRSLSANQRPGSVDVACFGASGAREDAALLAQRGGLASDDCLDVQGDGLPGHGAQLLAGRLGGGQHLAKLRRLGVGADGPGLECEALAKAAVGAYGGSDDPQRLGGG